ncbi:hypothetical protein COOONC_17821 [Cooperia oncophora]
MRLRAPSPGLNNSLKRASLREAYHEICSQFAGDVERKESAHLIEHLGKSLEDVDRSYQSVGAGGKELAADADSLLSMANVLLEAQNEVIFFFPRKFFFPTTRNG